MLPATKAILLMILAYMAGSIPFGFLISTAYGNIDIREHGSGNIGMTNVFRTLGPLPGLVTLLLDALKGSIVMLIALKWIPPSDWGEDFLLWGTLICMIAMLLVLGHSFPIWLRFKGGKSVAISLGILAVLMGGWVVVPIFVFVFVVAISRYVSLGSILAAISVPVIMSYFQAFPKPGNPSDNIFIGFGVLLAAIVIIRHLSNIKRLLTGKENRFRFGKKQNGEKQANTKMTPNEINKPEEENSGNPSA